MVAQECWIGELDDCAIQELSSYFVDDGYILMLKSSVSGEKWLNN